MIGIKLGINERRLEIRGLYIVQYLKKERQSDNETGPINRV